MPKKIIRELEIQLSNAQAQIQLLEKALKDAEGCLSKAQLNETAALLEIGHQVARLSNVQQPPGMAQVSYENRVLNLQLQSVLDRFNILDIEELENENHELRQEIMRLNEENMQLSRDIMANHFNARSDLARIQLAMEMEFRERLANLHISLRKELAESMDSKTKQMVSEVGVTQDTLMYMSQQATALEDEYRSLSRQQQQARVNEAVTQGLADKQAQQLVQLKNKLERSYTAINLLRRRLEDAEARFHAASAVGSHMQRQKSVASEGLEDSEELERMRKALERTEQRTHRLKEQRDRWKERSVLYENACAQLQAQLMLASDLRHLRLPTGALQDITSVWCKDAAAASRASTTPSTTSPNHEPYHTGNSPVDLHKGDNRIGELPAIVEEEPTSIEHHSIYSESRAPSISNWGQSEAQAFQFPTSPQWAHSQEAPKPTEDPRGQVLATEQEGLEGGGTRKEYMGEKAARSREQQEELQDYRSVLDDRGFASVVPISRLHEKKLDVSIPLGQAKEVQRPWSAAPATRTTRTLRPAQSSGRDGPDSAAALAAAITQWQTCLGGKTPQDPLIPSTLRSRPQSAPRPKPHSPYLGLTPPSHTTDRPSSSPMPSTLISSLSPTDGGKSLTRPWSSKSALGSSRGGLPRPNTAGSSRPQSVMAVYNVLHSPGVMFNSASTAPLGMKVAHKR